MLQKNYLDNIVNPSNNSQNLSPFHLTYCIPPPPVRLLIPTGWQAPLAPVPDRMDGGRSYVLAWTPSNLLRLSICLI